MNTTPKPAAHEDEDHDLGLSHDLPRLLNRRAALTIFSGVTLAALTGCATSASSTSSSSAVGSAAATTAAATSEIPEETAGPYPADGSNGRNILDQSGVVRSDITSSFGSSTTVAEGIPLTVALTIVDFSNGSAPLEGAAVYLWHCDRDGNYSMYSDAVVNENYLRGVQVADADGLVTFQSIYPACYSGRWPHIHFEIYPSIDEATTAGSRLRTTQLALPEDVSSSVYATTGYERSISNLAQVSLQSDNVFSDGYSMQMATVTGDTSSGFTASLNVPV